MVQMWITGTGRYRIMLHGTVSYIDEGKKNVFFGISFFFNSSLFVVWNKEELGMLIGTWRSIVLLAVLNKTIYFLSLFSFFFFWKSQKLKKFIPYSYFLWNSFSFRFNNKLFFFSFVLIREKIMSFPFWKFFLVFI